MIDFLICVLNVLFNCFCLFRSCIQLFAVVLIRQFYDACFMCSECLLGFVTKMKTDNLNSGKTFRTFSSCSSMSL